jgi:endonuclease/exonuclease/phosphatase (EEP) superfamily protein YafD
VSRLILLLAAASLAAALAAECGRWSVRLDLLADLAPLWFVSSALCVLAGSLLRAGHRGPALGLGLAGLAASGALLAPEFTRPISNARPRGGCERLRVIQLNVGGSGLADSESAAAWIAKQNPDLVFLDDGDQALRSALAHHGLFWRNGPGWTAIASRRPLRRAARLPGLADMPDLTLATYGEGAGRTDLIAAHIARPFVTGPQAARWTLPELKALVALYPASRRMILAGDFNLAPWSFQLRRLDGALTLERRDRAAFTWPARLLGRAWPLPVLPLDHVYAGAEWRTLDVSVGPSLGGTHLPLVVDLQSCPDGRRAG